MGDYTMCNITNQANGIMIYAVTIDRMATILDWRLSHPQLFSIEYMCKYVSICIRFFYMTSTACILLLLLLEHVKQNDNKNNESRMCFDFVTTFYSNRTYKTIWKRVSTKGKLHMVNFVCERKCVCVCVL